jgi:hypothetical protein
VTTVEVRVAAAKAQNRDSTGSVEDTLQGVDVRVEDFGDSDKVLNGSNTTFSWLDPSLSTFIHLGVKDTSQLTESNLKNLSCCS